jgi:hypothetical protein
VSISTSRSAHEQLPVWSKVVGEKPLAKIAGEKGCQPPHISLVASPFRIGKVVDHARIALPSLARDWPASAKLAPWPRR